MPEYKNNLHLVVFVCIMSLGTYPQSTCLATVERKFKLNKKYILSIFQIIILKNYYSNIDFDTCWYLVVLQHVTYITTDTSSQWF